MTESALSDRSLAGARVGQQWLILFVLMSTMMVSYIDRTLLAVLSQSIKQDLKLTDTMLGLLTGFAFSLVYALCSLPVARLADRGHRRATLTMCVAVWSLITCATGLCTTSGQLFLARFGVGAGEAGALPTAHAILADTYTPSRRGTALALFTVGAPLGMLIAFGLGGWLNAEVGWHATFAVLGAFGLLLAAILRFVLPADQPRPTSALASRTQLDLADILRLLRDRPFLHLLVGVALADGLMFGQIQWISPFFERNFPGHMATIGPLLASTRMAAMVVGLLIGGVVSDRLSRERIDVPIGFMAVVFGLGAVPQVLSYFAPDLWQALALSAIAGFVIASAGAPSAASVLNVAPSDTRATASALSVMASAVIGMGCGPLVVGYLSDLLAPHYGPQGLRIALVIINLVVTPWLIVHLLLAWSGVRQGRAIGGVGKNRTG